MKLIKILQWPAYVMEILAAIGLVAMMLVVTIDVVLRNIGVGYVYAVLDVMAIGLIFAAGMTLAVAFLRDTHLIVELGTFAMKPSHKSRLEAVWLFIGGPLLLVISYGVFERGLDLHAKGRTVGVLQYSPLYQYALVALAIAAAGIVALAMGLYKITGKRVAKSGDL